MSTSRGSAHRRRGPRSWTRSGCRPGADVVAITAEQLREVVQRLLAAGHWTAGDPEILIVMDAGYDAPRIAFLLADLPVQILGRLRGDRVFRRPAPPYVYNPKGGRPPKHGGEFVFGDPATWNTPNVSTATDNTRYAPRPHKPGTGYTRSLRTGAHGPTSSATCRSSKEPSSASRSTTCRPAAIRSRCGYGGRASTPRLRTLTGPGWRSCAGSISSTPSGS